MAGVIPPPQTPPTVVSTPAAPQMAIAQNPASNITSLPVGSSLDGVVTAQLPQSSLVEIQTDLGKLLLQSAVSLELDDNLHLTLHKKSPNHQFIIRNNLATGTEGASLPSASAAQTSAVTQNISAEGQVKVDIGVIVRATLLTAPTSGGSRAVSTEVTSKSASNGLLYAGDQVLQTLKNRLAQIFSRSAAAAATTHSVDLRSTLISGSKLDVRILDILSPPDGSAHSRPQVSLKPGQVFQGKVTSHLPSGFPLTDTPIGRLVLETVTHIATGSHLSMEIVSLPQAKGLEPGLSINLLPPQLSRDLPALTETVDFIEQLPPEIRASVPTPAIPRTGSLRMSCPHSQRAIAHRLGDCSNNIIS